MPQKAFRISAINLQTDKQEWYGPFPGDLHITYEKINAVVDGAPETIFRWDGGREDYAQDELDADATGWVGAEGQFIPDGWRRAYRGPIPGHPNSSFTQEAGPFWSDLSFYFGTVPDDYIWPDDWNALPTVVTPQYPTNPLLKHEYDSAGGYDFFEENRTR